MLKRCLLAAVLSLTAFAAHAFAQTTFVFEEAPRFMVPAQASDEPATFWVFSKGGPVEDAEVVVKDVKGPDGHARASTSVTATLDSPRVTPEGVRVRLKLPASLFDKPGEYRVILLFRSRSAPAAKVTPATATPVITYPPADINVDEVKNQTIEVTRSWPFGAGAQTFRLPLAETTGKGRLGELRWDDQGVFVKDTKVRAPGSVSVAPAPGPSPTQADAPAYMVTLGGLTDAGSFETNLVVNSPGLAARKVIPLRVNVADAVFFPALVIFVGVAAGFFVTYVSTRWRPQQLNRLRLMRLREELGRWRERVKAPAKVERVESMWARLRGLEEANEIGDAQLGTRLAAAEKELDELRKEEATAKAAAREALTQARDAADAYEQQFGQQFEPDEERDLRALRERLADVERLVGREQVDYAREKQAEADALFLGLRRRRLTRYLAELKKEFEALREQTAAADQKASGDLIRQAEQQLAGNKLDEAFVTLGALHDELEELDSKKTGTKLSRIFYSSPVERLAAEAAPRRRTRILISPAPAARTTDVNIRFSIDDREGLLREGDRVRWTFGEPGSQKEGEAAAAYRYRESGDYNVSAEVLRDGGVGPTFSETLSVLAGAQERGRREVVNSIKVADVALSAFALLLALLVGLNALYLGKPFGTLSDYLLALLWGFGLDQGVRGVADVLKKVSPAPASGGG